MEQYLSLRHYPTASSIGRNHMPYLVGALTGVLLTLLLQGRRH